MYDRSMHFDNPTVWFPWAYYPDKDGDTEVLLPRQESPWYPVFIKLPVKRDATTLGAWFMDEVLPRANGGTWMNQYGWPSFVSKVDYVNGDVEFWSMHDGMPWHVATFSALWEIEPYVG